jgi:hypothetical protein
MAANEHDTYNKKMPHRPILEFIPMVSVLDSQRIYRAPIDIVSVRVDPTISGHIPHFVR